MSVQLGWRLTDIERKADDALRIKYDVATLSSNVDNLERANRELRSEITELRAQLQTIQETIDRIEKYT